MIEKLAELEKRYVMIEEKLSDASVMCDMEAYKKLSKEYKGLTPIVEKYREYKKAQAEIVDSDEILGSEQDAEIRDLAIEQKEKYFCYRRILMMTKT